MSTPPPESAQADHAARRPDHGMARLSRHMAWAIGWLAVLGLFGRIDRHADALNQILPLWLAPAPFLFGFAFWKDRPGRLFLLLPALPIALLLACTIAPDWRMRLTPQTSARGPVIRLLVFNAWKDNRAPQEAADWILRQAPDAILLAEIGWKPGGLPDRLRKAYPYQIDCTGNRYCSTALLSRRRPVALRGLTRGDPENRGAVLAAAWMRFDAPCPFDLVGVHLDHPWPLKGSARSLPTLEAVAHRFGTDRTIVMGDFNLPPWTFAMRRLERQSGLIRRTLDLPSWPSRSAGPWAIAPLFPLDHLLAGRLWTTLSVERGPDLGSDHRPILVSLQSTTPC